MSKYLKKTLKLAQSLEYDKCIYVANFYANRYAKEISEKRWFGEPLLMKFENTHVNVPQNYDAYLTSLYGDYMQPPPKDKQTSVHDYIYLNLEKGYKE